jgi:hypothetical protein
MNQTYVPLMRSSPLNHRLRAYLGSQATVNTPDRTRPPVTTVPNTSSFTTRFSSTAPSTIGSIQPSTPLGRHSVLGPLLTVVILLCAITSVVIFYLLRVRGQRLPTQSSEPKSKTPLTPSKVQICQVIEVPELVANDSTMIDIQSPWSPINPRKLETPIGIGTEVSRKNLPVLQRNKSGYF